MSKNLIQRALRLTSALAFTGFSLTAFAPIARADTPSDAWITTKAKLGLMTAGHVGDDSVHVDANDGSVTLYGKATTAIEKDHAGEIVKGIAGVKTVHNLLQVVPAAAQKSVSQTDESIKTQVQLAIHDDGNVGSSIEVKSVDKGVVLLSGKATNLSCLLFAAESASRVPGVSRVVSEVKSPDTVASLDVGKIPAQAKRQARDAWITTDTKLRLLADGDVPALDISVETYRGVVTLFGTVPTAKARAAAIADAQKVDSTVTVHDELQVLSSTDQAIASADDGALRSEVLRALQSNSELKHVDVAVKSGVVRLTGQVSSGWNRLSAAIIARSAPGVRSVDDDIQVKGARG